MKLSSLFVAAALLSVQDHPNDAMTATPAAPRVLDRGALRPGPSEPPVTPVDLGDIAPDFSFQGTDGQWRHLHDLLHHGPVLLVFGPHEPVLRAIERDRERLTDHGVVPVAILDAHSGTARSTVLRLNLRYTVLADSRGVIATQFNTVDPRSGRTLPSLFVLDRSRRVRALEREALPLAGYAALTASALGIPARARPVPASRIGGPR